MRRKHHDVAVHHNILPMHSVQTRPCLKEHPLGELEIIRLKF